MNCPGWELSGMGTVRDGNCPPGGNCPGWELSGMGTVHLVGIVRDGNCPDTLRTYKINYKENFLVIKKGLCGAGRLRNKAMNTLQNYYD